MDKNNFSKKISLILGILIICFGVAFYITAWQEPNSSPTGENVDAPLNISSENQTKEGGLTLNTGGSENALVIDQGNFCLAGDCRSSWAEEAGIPTTYQMSATAFIQEPIYYAKSTSYSCPEGFSAIMTSCSTLLQDGREYPDFNACVCSTGGRTASLTQQVSKCDSYMGSSGCSPASSCTPYTWYDSEGWEYMSIWCELPINDASCVMEFQCGVKLQVNCTSGSQCASGHCVDGYCCNTACDQPCYACNISNHEGTCSPLTGTYVEDAGCTTPCMGCLAGECVALPNNTQDVYGANVCNQTCKKCSEGSCINQASFEDLFNQCPAAGCTTGDCAGSSGTCALSVNPIVVVAQENKSCTQTCQTYSGCSSCVSIGTDAGANNMKYWTWETYCWDEGCYSYGVQQSGNCSSYIPTRSFYDYWTGYISIPATFCKCQ